MFQDKTILITGGTGSFGSNFTKYLLANYSFKKLIIFSRDERKQAQMASEVKDPRLRFFIGDVRDLARLERAFHGVDVVVHAAALKQVPILEYNPFEAVQTNIIGSQNVIEAAISQTVNKVLLISSDKAVRPVNLYGSTKLCAEKLFTAGNVYAHDSVRFSCVRYGNVIGSRGSIVEALLKCRPGDKVCLTDERMTRFWITLEQSFNTVLVALGQMIGGEIFVPKIPSMKLVDLFEALAPQNPREIVGIRPGEKLHESLLTPEESRHAVDYGDHFVILPEHEDIFNKAKYDKYLSGGRSLPQDFHFASHTNPDWLDKEQISKLVKNFNLAG